MLEMATLRRDSEVEAIMEMSEKQIEALGFTEHSRRHGRTHANAVEAPVRGEDVEEEEPQHPALQKRRRERGGKHAEEREDDQDQATVLLA